jgi:DUF2947 family protein
MISYRPLGPKRDWYFFDEKYPVPGTVLPLIRPLTEQSARELWWCLVSTAGRHTMVLPGGGWPQQLLHSETRYPWHQDWNSGHPRRIAEVFRRHLPWYEDAPTHFFRCDERAVEVPWRVFVEHWPSFLFRDEGPILHSREYPEAVVFGPNGYLYIGTRTAGRERRERAVGGWVSHAAGLRGIAG